VGFGVGLVVFALYFLSNGGFSARLVGSALVFGAFNRSVFLTCPPLAVYFCAPFPFSTLAEQASFAFTGGFGVFAVLGFVFTSPFLFLFCHFHGSP
jgi:hypothetical protein